MDATILMFVLGGLLFIIMAVLAVLRTIHISKILKQLENKSKSTFDIPVPQPEFKPKKSFFKKPQQVDNNFQQQYQQPIQQQIQQQPVQQQYQPQYQQPIQQQNNQEQSQESYDEQLRRLRKNYENSR